MQNSFITPNQLFLIAAACLFNMQLLYAQVAVNPNPSNGTFKIISNQPL